MKAVSRKTASLRIVLLLSVFVCAILFTACGNEAKPNEKRIKEDLNNADVFGDCEITKVHITKSDSSEETRFIADFEFDAKNSFSRIGGFGTISYHLYDQGWRVLGYYAESTTAEITDYSAALKSFEPAVAEALSSSQALLTGYEIIKTSLVRTDNSSHDRLFADVSFVGISSVFEIEGTATMRAYLGDYQTGWALETDNVEVSAITVADYSPFLGKYDAHEFYLDKYYNGPDADFQVLAIDSKEIHFSINGDSFVWKRDLDHEEGTNYYMCYTPSGTAFNAFSEIADSYPQAGILLNCTWYRGFSEERIGFGLTHLNGKLYSGTAKRNTLS